MNQNISLLSALRRNRQKRGLQSFLANFSQSTGLTVVEDDIVDSALSVRSEGLLDAVIQERLSNGSLKRIPELMWKEVQEQLDTYAAYGIQGTYLAFLCHYRDFTFRLNLNAFVTHAKQIVEFDGDSVYVSCQDLLHGFGIDMYVSELVNECRYTVDSW
jgi:hypothetical protein